MSTNRVFLGWDEPGLRRAADWLRRRYAQGERWDLSGVLLVVPARRAGRRLLEILAEQAAGLILTPPELVTPGSLPERLYHGDRPVADDLCALLARVQALRQAAPDLLCQVAAHPPQADDLPGWLLLAQDLARLNADLAGEMVPIGAVAARCAAVTDFTEQPRWEALARLQEMYEQALAQAGLIDQHAARARALEQGGCATTRNIILLATPDLNRLVRSMLAAVAQRVTALIHAPESLSAAFDELGCLMVEQWEQRPLEISAEAIRVVDRPRDQAYAVLTALQGIAEKSAGSPLSADQITVGVGDETMVPLIERVLDLAGVPARSAAGKPLRQSPPALFLAALAHHLATGRFDDLAALLRHPDVENYLRHTFSGGKGGSGPKKPGWVGNSGDDLLSLLDRYLTDHLQGRISTHWLGDPETIARLKDACDALAALTPVDFAQRKPLPQWSQPIAAALTGIYAYCELSIGDERSAQLISALEQIGSALRQQAQLDSESSLTPRLTLAEAIALTLIRLADQAIPAPAGTPAVELLGWLELQLDDAPTLIVAGVNEGAIPESVNADAFLPDRIRRILGLLDNRRRLTRDLAALAAILHSRPHVCLISGRRGADDHPLTPSRLLLQGDPERLAQRVLAFLGADTKSGSAAPLLLASGRDRFIVPPPQPPAQPLAKLRVTAFRDYLVCPYRFYLRHVRQLAILDDRAVEMDGMRFGNLAHEILQRLGRSELADSTEAQALRRFLDEQLDRLGRAHFSGEPPAAVLIQSEQLRQRLHRLAHWQAQQVRDGWRIQREHIEADLTAVIDVDGQPFTITGRIDRIDLHPEQGYRVLDYKTSDAGQPPEKTHRCNGEWIDLQLPLYARLVAQAGITGPLQLGYVQLPKDLDAIGLAPAQWSAEDLRFALDKAIEIIRHVRAGVFWPPMYPMDHDDFAGICMNESLDRGAALEPGDKSVSELEGRP